MVARQRSVGLLGTATNLRSVQGLVGELQFSSLLLLATNPNKSQDRNISSTLSCVLPQHPTLDCAVQLFEDGPSDPSFIFPALSCTDDLHHLSLKLKSAASNPFLCQLIMQKAGETCGLHSFVTHENTRRPPPYQTRFSSDILAEVER
jgi:hypothetical protein